MVVAHSARTVGEHTPCRSPSARVMRAMLGVADVNHAVNSMSPAKDRLLATYNIEARERRTTFM